MTCMTESYDPQYNNYDFIVPFSLIPMFQNRPTHPANAILTLVRDGCVARKNDCISHILQAGIDITLQNHIIINNEN
jgi:hypothetical protein